MRVFVAIVLALSMCACHGGTPFPTSPTTTTPPNVPLPPAPGFGAATLTLKGVSLSGVVYELTPTGRTPIAGAIVYCEPCGEETHTFATADDNGFYNFSGDRARGGGVWVAAGVPTPSPWVTTTKTSKIRPGYPR